MSKPIAVLNVDMFEMQVAVFRSEEKAEKYFSKLGIEFPRVVGPANASAHSFTANDRHWHAMILPKDLARSSVAHEAVHIADFIMDDAGVPCNVENTEVRAYLVAQLLRQIWAEE